MRNLLFIFSIFLSGNVFAEREGGGQYLNYVTGTSQGIHKAAGNLTARLNAISPELWSKVFDLGSVEPVELVAIINNIKFSPERNIGKMPLTHGIYNGKRGIEVLGEFYRMILDNKILDPKYDPVEASEDASIGRFLLSESLSHFGYSVDQAWTVSRKAFPGSKEAFDKCTELSVKYPGGKCFFPSIEYNVWETAFSAIKYWLNTGSSQNSLAIAFDTGSYPDIYTITFSLDSTQKRVQFNNRLAKSIAVDFTTREYDGNKKNKKTVVLKAKCEVDVTNVNCVHDTLHPDYLEPKGIHHIYWFDANTSEFILKERNDRTLQNKELKLLKPAIFIK